MEVTWVFKDGSVSDTESMPCFGNTGRIDWKGCNPDKYDELYTLSNKMNISGPNQRGSEQDSWNEGVHAIRLVSDDTFSHLFHVRLRSLMDYIVHRSIWSPLFEKSVEEIQSDNYVDLLVNTNVPSEVQTSLHIWMRDVLNCSDIGETFDQLVKRLGNEHLAFAVALLMPKLSSGQSYHTIGNEGLTQSFNLAFWHSPSLDKLSTIPMNMGEVHGYAMNISRVWKTALPSMPTYRAMLLADNMRVLSTNYQVMGIFGNVTLNGIKDPMDAVYNELLKAGLV
jgi:hypothetical protein